MLEDDEDDSLFECEEVEWVVLEEEGDNLECDLLFDDVHGSLSECEEVE